MDSIPSPLGRVIHAGLWVNSAGPMHMRALNHYGVTLTLKGRADYRSPVGGTHTLGPGDLVINFPGVPHLYGPSAGHDWTEFFMDFDGPAFELWTHSRMLDATKPIYHLEPIEYWHRRLREVVDSPNVGSSEVAAVRVCHLQQFLADAIAHHHNRVAGQANLTWLSEAKALLDSRGEQPPDLHELADKFAMSYETFRKKFVALAGISPGAYRIHRSIDRAGRLLVERRDLSLKQVASQCGFCNEFYFSKQFKQVVGLSPSGFRRRFFGAESPKP